MFRSLLVGNDESANQIMLIESNKQSFRLKTEQMGFDDVLSISCLHTVMPYTSYWYIVGIV